MTWGKRQRKRKRIIPTIFQDPVEEEEDNADTSVSGGFFNHQEENPMERFKKRLARFNPGILRKILSKLISSKELLFSPLRGYPCLLPLFVTSDK